MRIFPLTCIALCLLSGTGYSNAADIILERLPAVASDPETHSSPQSLTFNSDRTKVVGNLTDGSIYAWPLTGSAPQLIAQTEQAFAYCPAAERMVISGGKAAVLLSLRDGGYAALSEGLFDYADFSADCGTMLLAEAGTSAVEYWQISETPVLRNVATLNPVRNGITLSASGQNFAVATAEELEDPTADTAIETFALTEDGLQRLGRLQIDDAIVGLGDIELTASGALITTIQQNRKSGILANDLGTKGILWSWAGFSATELNALVLSSDELTVLTGDSSGQVALWSVENGRNLAQINVGQPVISAALSDDVTRAAIGLKGGTVLILDVEALLAGN